MAAMEYISPQMHTTFLVFYLLLILDSDGLKPPAGERINPEICAPAIFMKPQLSQPQ
jgi:hypothetical protein